MNEDMAILIAEDNAGHFQLIKKNLWLTCVNKVFLLFKDGQEILDFLFKNGNDMHLEQKQQFVLLLDIRMPKVDGIEVLKKIKDDEELRKIPIIMLTTTGDANMVKQCYELGCSYYMVKPVNYHQFLKAVHSLGEFLSLGGMRLPFIKKSNV